MTTFQQIVAAAPMVLGAIPIAGSVLVLAKNVGELTATVKGLVLADQTEREERKQADDKLDARVTFLERERGSE